MACDDTQIYARSSGSWVHGAGVTCTTMTPADDAHTDDDDFCDDGCSCCWCCCCRSYCLDDNARDDDGFHGLVFCVVLLSLFRGDFLLL